ncbi:hypothetical protein CVT24_000340 [Panaeolus cyanescens]|uniref:Uncharacterized protein n=1 Tax=Panaeolus cyanescens TaxID=181874 RepID=A0A409VJ00_9AGAR|nr:hypothetical protein CVT24_000340 [Panaeolus cyanescens]
MVWIELSEVGAVYIFLAVPFKRSMFAGTGVQSFVLAVNPSDPTDMGFLGGSLLGREFWRGLRSGGEQGARAFKTTCINRLPKNPSSHPFNQSTSQVTSSTPSPAPTPSVSLASKSGPSKSLKTELYESVRTALRAVSGHRTAEMKWTNPERLDAFGVRLVGWPEGIPQQNPSTLKSSQNRQLLDALQKGTMKFERLFGDPVAQSSSDTDKAKAQTSPDKQLEEDDFSWAYDSGPSEASQVTLPAEDSQSSRSTSASRAPTGPLLKPKRDPLPTPQSPVISEMDDSPWRMDTSQMDISSGLGTYNVDFGWDEFSDHLLSTIGSDWDNESSVVRPKKRPRTENETDDANSDAISQQEVGT